MPPLVRSLEVTGPQRPVRGSGDRLVSDVGEAVVRVGDSPSLAHQLASDVCSLRYTDRDRAPVVVVIARLAGGRAVTDGALQRCFRVPTAGIEHRWRSSSSTALLV